MNAKIRRMRLMEWLAVGLSSLILITGLLLFVLGTPRSAIANPAAPNTVYTVNSSSDLIVIPSCAGAANDCTLRGAVQLANTSAGADTINISPTVTAISLNSSITLTDDGIQINGNGQKVTSLRTMGNFPALVINSNNNAIAGFWINAHMSHAGAAQHGVVLNGDHNLIWLNSLSDLGGDGVLIQGSATGNDLSMNVIGVRTVGGTQWADCSFRNDQWGVQIVNVSSNYLFNNTIGCSGLDGVIISGTNASSNEVFNTYVGVTDWAGRVPNTLAGVAVLSGAHDNLIGFWSSYGNVIGANGTYGVFIGGSGTHANLVTMNSIGISGTTNISNTIDGVTIQGGATANRVVTNTIAYNAHSGVYLLNAIGNIIENNRIHHQVQSGLWVEGGNANVFSANLIGIETSGNSQLAGCNFHNHEWGIRLNNSGANQVSGNTIGCSGNDGLGLSGAGANGNQIYGNTIGVISGGGQVTNTLAGIALWGGAHDNAIGTATTGNIIGSNGTYGVYLGDSSTATNTIQLNSIGISGTLNISNTLDGVAIVGGAHVNRVVTNTIADNGHNGVWLNAAGTNSNVLQANVIRLNQMAGVSIENGAQSNHVVTNTVADNTNNGVLLTGASTAFNELRGNTIRLNGLHTGSAGVRLDNGAAFNSIGVYGNRAAGNVISANWDGVVIDGSTTGYNGVYGNYIGTNAAGNAADQNQDVGVMLNNGTFGNAIGWLASERNVISGNYQDGMMMLNGAHDNSVRSNDIGLNRDFPPVAVADAYAAAASGPASPAGGGAYLNLHNFYGIRAGGVYSNIIGGYIGGTPAANYIFYNTASGVMLQGGSQHNVVGLNVISGSGQDGVSLFDAGTTANTITRTLIDHSFRAGILEDLNVSSNVWTEVGIAASGELGIDMGGAGLTVPYVFIDAINRATGVVSGHGHATDGALNITTVELYRVWPNPSGYGEGQTFVGRATTDASGNWTITDTLPAHASACYTAFITESHPFLLIPAYSSEFSVNTCRVLLPLASKN